MTPAKKKKKPIKRPTRITKKQRDELLELLVNWDSQVKYATLELVAGFELLGANNQDIRSLLMARLYPRLMTIICETPGLMKNRPEAKKKDG